MTLYTQTTKSIMLRLEHFTQGLSDTHSQHGVLMVFVYCKYRLLEKGNIPTYHQPMKMSLFQLTELLLYTTSLLILLISFSCKCNDICIRIGSNVKSCNPVASNKQAKQPVAKNILRHYKTYSTTNRSKLNSEPNAHLHATYLPHVQSHVPFNISIVLFYHICPTKA
jgi:hypothetical protein